ncbi:hypothetical protein Sme01_52210 [Sphaerisporangium melleum]|uniref:DUF4184 family protein n=1 Tax=Sphaerisporangium melleum TaxID=321316 RepID=A0A917VH77_9ACTN|nr:DUF4184 family protein [Sphaerisporangium melleum]GGK76428.1 hypothetical protein GCM10007964_18970 [Sphaerisporangium melleum]GII72745.1 hypothetical protein Sme01_52210 [Sphaerisporangium melleum]
MPFTPSHVAAVIPLIGSPRARKVFDPWALGVGAMVPDLPMFLPYLQDYSRWHSPAGVVTDDVAAVFVLLAVLQFVLRDPLTALLPGTLAARVAALPGPDWRRFWAIALGAAAGAATHVLWDSFTHDWGAAFWGWGWMTAPVLGWLNGYRLAQYGSSAFGLALTAWWLLRALRTPAPVPAPAATPGAGTAPPSASASAAGTVPASASRTAPTAPPASVPRAPVAAPARGTRLPERVRWGVLAGTVAAACCSAAVWPLVDPPNPVYGWAGVVTRIGVGLLIGLGAVLTVYALLWQLARVIRLSRA